MASTPLRRLGATLLAAGSMLAGAAHAQYTSLTIFGDSLSDTGNVFTATGGTQPPPSQPYAGGGVSNGPLWTDLLATSLGQPAAGQPSLLGGTNYAWAAARTVGGTVPSIDVQVTTTGAGFWGGVPVDPTGLYVLVAGGNDMRDARSSFPTDSPEDQASRQAAAAAAAANLRDVLSKLATRGVRNVLLGNLPNLGYTPEAAGLNLVAASADASTRFNAEFPSLLDAGRSFGLNMMFVDFAGLGTAVRNDALFNNGATYGLTNALFPCAGFTGSNGASCSVSMFSDALHPSAATHALMAQAALAAVPEPATWLSLALGLALLPVLARRR